MTRPGHISFCLTIVLVLSLLFSGYRSDFDSKAHQENRISIEISLGKIKPGPISLTQIRSVNKLNLRSKGKKYQAKSYELIIIPKSGASQFIDCTRNRLPEDGLSLILKSQPGDQIMIANLVIDGIDKYEMAESPVWTVSEAKK